MSDWIATKSHSNWFEIKLNRADKLNAIQMKMLIDLADAVSEAERTDGVRLIVIRGEGKAFCAGLDLMAMGGNADVMGENWMKFPHETTRMWQQQLNRLVESPLPTLALLHGYCLGLGTEIALACDMRYAAPDVQMSLAETKIGMIPDVGGTTRLTKLIGPGRAKEMIFTSRRISADVADKWGLVNLIVARDAFDDVAQVLADEIEGCAPLAVAAAKRAIQGILDEQTGLNLEAIEQAPLFRTKDLEIGAQAAMMKQKPEWKGK